MTASLTEKIRGLPKFEENPFRNEQGLPQIWERALVTFNETPKADPPFSRVGIYHVVGRTPDSKTIYVSRDIMKYADGRPNTTYPDGLGDNQIDVSGIERYELLLTQEEIAEHAPGSFFDD